MSKLLTIIVPTYNRCEYITKLVPALWENIADCRDKIHIVVSNNASTDATQERLLEFRANGIEFDLLCKETNVGPDRNFTEALARIDTRYCWLLGDDDLPMPGAVESVLAALERSEPALLYLRSGWFDDAFDPTIAGTDVRIPETPVDDLDFATRINYWVTFISGIVFDAQLYKRIAPTGPPIEWLSSSMVQLHWVLNLLKYGKNFLVSDDVMIKATGNNSGGYSILQIFGVNFPRLVDAVLGPSSRIGRLIKKSNEYSNLPQLLYTVRFANLGNFKGESVSSDLERGWTGSASSIRLYRMILTGSATTAALARTTLKGLGKIASLSRALRLNLRNARLSLNHLGEKVVRRAQHLSWGLRGRRWCRRTGGSAPASARIGPGGQYRGLNGVRMNGFFFAGKRSRIELYDKHGGDRFSPLLWIGDRVSMENDCHIGVVDRVELHDGVMLASRVYISDHAHGHTGESQRLLAPADRPLYSRGPVIIEKNVWIGEGAVILPGVRIGAGAIIGANAVVTRDIPSMAVAVGAPARAIARPGTPAANATIE